MRTLTTVVTLLVCLGATSARATPGDLDPTFGTGGVTVTPLATGDEDNGYAVALQSDGKIVVAGLSWNGSSYDFVVLRYLVSGTLDPAFGTGGVVRTPLGTPSFFKVDAVVQPDDRIVVVGSAPDPTINRFTLVRYEPDGALDATFGAGGIVQTAVGPAFSGADAVALQPDGKIVSGGHSCIAVCNIAVTRHLANGSPDGAFGTNGATISPVVGAVDSSRLDDLTIGPDGSIVATGSAIVSTMPFDTSIVTVRWLANGTLDPSFGTGGVVMTNLTPGVDHGNAVALQPDGKILVGGQSDTGDLVVLRYDDDGAIDTGFGTAGVAGPSGMLGAIVALIVEPNLSIVAAATGTTGANDLDAVVMQFTPTGMLDPAFGVGGIAAAVRTPSNENLHGMAMQANRALVVVGTTSPGSMSSGNNILVARFLNPLCGDGSTEVGEACDEGALNGMPGSCCSNVCTFLPPSATCRAPAGGCDAPDSCTGSSGTCPDAKHTGECRPASGPCDAAESCDGVGNDCPSDGSQPSGTSCGPDSLCGSSPTCDGAGTCVVTPEPDLSCTTPLLAAGASLRIVVRPSTESIQFKWRKGPVVPKADFGTPGVAPDYDFCVYDQDPPGSWALVYAGALAGTWKERTTGWKLSSSTGAPDGVRSAVLKEGLIPHRAKVQVKVKRSTTGSIVLPLVKNPGVLAQVRTSDGMCWGATFSTPSKSDTSRFTAKSD